MKQIKILSHTYEIDYDKNHSLVTGKAATIVFELNLIKIDSNCSDSVQSEALQHEIFHALSHHLGLELTESQITALSEGFFLARQENKGIL